MIQNNRKIKVLMPVLHYPPVIGGFEVFIQNIAERLGRDLPIWVVTGKVKGIKNYEEKGQLKIIRTSLWQLNNLSYTSKAYRLITLVFIFFKSLWLIISANWRKEKITLLHCHGFFSGLVGLALKKLTGTPYLITIQSADLNIYHPRLEKRFWRLIHFWDFLKFLEKKIYLNAFKCHSVSKYLSDYYGDYGIKDSVVIPNGVDQELFKSIKDKKDLVEELREKLNKKHNLNLAPGMKILVNVSRLEKKNGIDVLIEALPFLNIGNYVLLIIGDGSERKYLEQLVKDKNLQNKVKFLGDMINTEVPEYLQVADLFVRIPLAEGFGIVYIEAMACGTPVIATPVGGIIDIITADKKIEIICEVNNPVDTANKINNFFNDEFAIHKLRDWGLTMVKVRYNWNNIVEEIKKLYLQPRLVLATGIFPPDIGGPATYSESLLRELPKHDFNVKVITYSDGDELRSTNYESRNLIRINRKKILPLRYFSYFWQLKKLAKGADLIYAQCPLSSGLPTYLVSKITKKPYLIKITGDYVWEQAQNRFGNKDLIDEFQKKKYNWKIELMRRLERMTTGNAKQIIVPSEYLKKIVMGWGIDENKIKVIYNSFNYYESRTQNRENFILSAGRLEPWKGFETLIRLMPQLPPELKLIIAGDGSEEENFKKQIIELKLEDRVKLVGRLSSPELKNYYERAKMFVLNTAYEGFSHIILEAMAAGLPVITTNVGGNPELINELLVEYNNEEQIREAILKIYNNPNLANRLVEQNYEKLKQFSFEKMINQTIEILSGGRIQIEDNSFKKELIALLQINYSADHSEVTLPLGTLSVGSALVKAGFKVKLINITEKQIDKTAEEIIELSPLYLGVSVMTGIQTRYSAELCQKIKAKNPAIKIVWGGIHPSLLPEQCLNENYLDFVVIGEGEITAVELAEKLMKPEDDFGEVLGLGWKKNEQTVINPPRPFIANLDEYRLNFNLVDLNKYLFRLKGAKRTIAYKTSRGCPFNCAFCYNRAFNKNRWRVWSIDSVVEDINWLRKNYQIDAVKFYDDNFFIDQHRTFELLEKINLPSHLEIRIDMITDEVAKKLKDLKVSELLIGIESGSDRMLNLINKGYNVERIKEGVKTLAKHDLYVTYSTIVGLPTETEEEFNQTLELMNWIHQVHPRAGFTLGAYLPYPGSLMYQFAIEQGFKPPAKTIDWGKIDRFRKDFASPWVDNQKVWRIREYFKFFSYNVNIISRWSEFRLKRKIFSWPLDIYLIEFLAGLAIEEKGLIGRLLRKIHNSVKKFK